MISGSYYMKVISIAVIILATNHTHPGPAWYKHVVMLVGGCYRGNIAMGGGHHGNSTVF